jgi:diacylglycerol O-acyltransferase / wax synthase
VRMSDAEALMWAVEKDPALRSDFCNLTILEHAPEEKRLRRTLERALDAIPRLRQRVVSPPLRIAPPAFTDDPSLDIDYHVRRIAVPPPGDERAVLDICERLAESSLDRSRPLWEFTLIDGLHDGQAALLQKVHHTISDGVGALKLSLALLDFEADPPVVDDSLVDDSVDASSASAPPRGGDHPVAVFRSAVHDTAARDLGALRGAAGATVHTVTHPQTIPSRVLGSARLAQALRRQVVVADRPQSALLGGRSLRRRFETHRVGLEPLKRVAAARGGSVNDAYVTALCAALGRYHARNGSDVTELRMAMPISTRGRADTGANRFAPARVLVPIQPAYGLDSLFAEVHERLARAKQDPALEVVDGLAGFATLLPTSMLVALTRSQVRTIDFAASNLRGSPVPLYLAGSRILADYPFGPRVGAALNVTTLGYTDALDLGINVDPAAFTDVDGFMIDLRTAFNALEALAR